MYLYGIEILHASLDRLLVVSSNCTFMELKFSRTTFTDDGTEGSNCTFMELKLAFSNLRVVGLLF